MPTPPTAPGILTPTYGASGLAALGYDSNSFTQSLDPLALIVFADGSSPVNPGSTGSSWDATAKTKTISYTWGSYAITYGPAVNNRLDLSITVSNTSGQSIRGFVAYLLAGLGMTGATESRAWTNSEPASAIATFTQGNGGYFALVNPGSVINATLWIQAITGGCHVAFSTIRPNSDANWPDSRDLPIADGGSQTYSLSLRFAPAGTSIADLASDAYEQFTTARPFLLNWPDRRPITAWFSSGSQWVTATNPNGYLNASVDVTTPEGLAALRIAMLAEAQACIMVAQQTNAQGLIWWDIGGARNSNLTYYGDPEAEIELVAPAELKYRATPSGPMLVDEIFSLWRDAGLKTGVTLRPQNIVDTGGGVLAAMQVDEADQVADFIAKIGYAKNRWDVSMAYIDSTIPSDQHLIGQGIHEACPNFLVIPENESFAMSAVSAPYDDIRLGQMGPTANIKYAYPQAFNAISGMAGDLVANHDALVAAVRGGCLMICHANVFQAGEHQEILDIYAEAGISTPPDRAILLELMNV